MYPHNYKVENERVRIYDNKYIEKNILRKII